ncbi:uncharacterized protein OCT59_001363 [Rhizophagus irregularis]|uniref:uncharacterized protein n=1 Tax=Rhizophagus irregularis TaxID=588596 RepID=UPI001C1388A5|nr:hypothetical protein OCT59_001363 [Rhizophagus irregularis]CAB4487250.1 unnamed protein product [Rhizophagus irregularis]
MLYKARQTNTSNILKIIFNFAQIVRSEANLGLYMTSKKATYTQCDALLRTIIVGNIITRLSLSAFLIWRLRQIRNVHNFGSDKWISIILFSIKIALSIPYFIFQRASTEYVPDVDLVGCFVDSFTPIPYGASGIAVEFLIDIFIPFRLVQILINANKNAAQVSTNIKSKRSLFTAVMYWNFLRLFVSFVFHSLAVLDMIYVLPEVESITIKNIVYNVIISRYLHIKYSWQILLFKNQRESGGTFCDFPNPLSIPRIGPYERDLKLTSRIIGRVFEYLN